MRNSNRRVKFRNRNTGKNIFSKKILGVSLSVLLPGVALAYVGVTLPTWTYTQSSIMATVSESVAEHTGIISGVISAMTTSLTGQITNYTDMVNDALKVAVEQQKVSDQSIMENAHNASQTLAVAYQATKAKNDAINVNLNFGSKTGQGYGACTVIASNANMDQAANKAAVVAAQEAATTASGNLDSNYDQYDKNRMDLHRKEFCTAAEAAATGCTVSTLPGGDTNANLLFTGATPGSKEALARELVRESITGKPMRGINPTAGQTPSGQEYLFRTNEQASLMSFPAMSLAAIDAANLRTSKDAQGNPASADEIIQQTVSRYYGGPQAKDWQHAMLAQEPRGLLVEAARINGLNTWLNEKMYEQNLRIEGNLAALALASSKPIKNKLDEQSRKVSLVNFNSTIASYQ